jgi:hypothetical protein
MSHFKFSGLLKEAIEQYPKIDITEFLQERLNIPLDKAEVLAARIEKEFSLNSQCKTGQNLVKGILEKPIKPEAPPKASAYSVDGLCQKEFEHFLKWLLEELGYEVTPEKRSGASGPDLVSAKDGEKIAIHAKRCPKNMKASNLIVSRAQDTKGACGCQRAIVITTGYFTQQAIEDAEKLGVELWDRDTLDAKIAEVRKHSELEEQSCFTQYKGSLLQSLLRLEETKDFMIEPKADGKYDLYLPGVKYPLLTFQAEGDDVIRCVFRIKYNEPVGEFAGEALIGIDRKNERFGPEGVDAYTSIIKYLEQFVE